MNAATAVVHNSDRADHNFATNLVNEAWFHSPRAYCHGCIMPEGGRAITILVDQNGEGPLVITIDAAVSYDQRAARNFDDRDEAIDYLFEQIKEYRSAGLTFGEIRTTGREG